MQRYGLIGFPLKNSYSANYFNQKFAEQGIDAIYQNFALERIEEFPDLIKNHQDLNGLNITIPFKQQVIPFLNHLDLVAQQIGAVNTIKFTQNQLIGYNTDVFGFEKSILPLLKPWHQSALVLGTGGASKAVNYVLNKLGIKHTQVTRKADEGLLYEELDKSFMRSHQIIINCTPLGMFPLVDDFPPIPYNYITNLHLVYDLIYLPEETLFLKQARENGAIIKNGLEMLTLQAEKAWQIWNE
jgi:shikimate dehydrogenase